MARRFVTRVTRQSLDGTGTAYGALCLHGQGASWRCDSTGTSVNQNAHTPLLPEDIEVLLPPGPGLLETIYSPQLEHSAIEDTL